MPTTSLPTNRLAQKAVSLALLVLAVTAFAGCKSPAERRRVLTKDQQQQIADNVLATAPSPKTVADVDFEGHIRLLGYDVDGVPKAGETIRITSYYRVDKPVSGDWKIFVHFESPGKRRQPFDHYGVGDLYPVGEWKKGEIIADKVDIAIPADWPSGKTQVLIGFFDWGAWSKAGQNRRLKVAGEGRKLATNDDRVILTTIDVVGGRPGGAAVARTPREAQPTLRAVRVSVAPTIDGRLDDPAWESVRPTAKFSQPDGKALDDAHETTARVAWDDDNLYVAWQTRDADIQNRYREHDSTLWEGDVVELFLAPDDADGAYYELQFAPNLGHFDAKFSGHRQPAWQTAAAWESEAKFAVHVDGTVNGDGPDQGWSVEAAIPWKAFGLLAAPMGRTWQANFYRIDSAGTHDLSHMGAWVPIGGDFHALSQAGRIHFSGR